VRDGQVSSKSFLNILWEKEVFFLLSQFHLNPFTEGKEKTKMASLAMAFPILPGKTEQWKHFIQELAGPRRSEYEASNKRIGATRAALYLQQTPQGDMVVLYQEAADMQHFFEAMGLSQEPYFVWFREQVKDIHGVDFSQPLPGPLPEAFMDWRAK
jgi:hypothetical protein